MKAIYMLIVIVCPLLINAAANKLTFVKRGIQKVAGIKNLHDTTKNVLRSNEEKYSRASFTGTIATKNILGITANNRQVEAYFFPGTSNKKALIIGGVHGSELSAIEVAYKIIEELKNGKAPYYNVVIIPCLFPDNAAKAIKNSNLIGSVDNVGRYTTIQSIDPNRQMPTPGKMYDKSNIVDHYKRGIEKENIMLINLINEYRPERIANLHSIRDTAYAGVYADPRTDASGYALGFESDSAIAIDMAKYMHDNNGYVPGNNLNSLPTAIYHNDPGAVSKGAYQNRNICGSFLSNNRGCGASLGTWATTAVEDSLDPSANRDAIILITVEFPGSKRPIDYTNKQQQIFYQQQVNIYASAIINKFLNIDAADATSESLVSK